MRLQRAEDHLGVPSKRAFQFAYFAIIRPAEQVVTPGSLLVVE
jgi:hypothetical protein